METPKLLTVVVPVFNEEESLPEAIRRLIAVRDSVLDEVDMRFVFVDDGSRDRSLEILREHAVDRPFIKALALSRNFGHQIAITAGIDIAAGDFVAVIDADLQDPPELIPEMFRIALKGADVVYGRRRSRAGESVFKKTSAVAFYRFLSFICDIDIPQDTGDFRLMSRRAIDAFKQLRETHRFVRGMVPWIGFRAVPLEYDRAERFAGETKYPIGKMIAFATNAILSFSRKPLTIAIRVGFLTILAGIVFGSYLLYLKLFTNIPVPGVTAIILSIVIFSGVQIFLVGIVGAYIARIFEEVKGRPLYFVSEIINH